MFMWNVSRWSFTAGDLTALIRRSALVAGVEEVGLKPVEGFDAEGHALGFGVAGEDLEVLHHEGPLDFLLGRGDGIRLAHDRVNRADEGGTAHDRRLVDQRHAVGHARGLFLVGATKIATRSHRRTHAADGDAGLVGRGLDLHRVDVTRVLDRDFHGVIAPGLELLEQADARGREGRGIEEGIKSKSHRRRRETRVERTGKKGTASIGFGARLSTPQRGPPPGGRLRERRRGRR
jgi:hypothetical protein